MMNAYAPHNAVRKASKRGGHLTRHAIILANHHANRPKNSFGNESARSAKRSHVTIILGNNEGLPFFSRERNECGGFSELGCEWFFHHDGQAAGEGLTARLGMTISRGGNNDRI